MLQKNEALNEYILIMSTKVTCSTDAYGKNVSTKVIHSGERVNSNSLFDRKSVHV